MAKTTLRGRFSPGSVVNLYEVADASVLRAEGEPDQTETVNDKGEVSFSLKDGHRYIAQAYDRGEPRSVRLTGRSGDEDVALEQAPIGPDRVRMSDGSWSDEAPEKVKKGDLPLEAAPHLSQTQIGDDVPQRSATPRGTAHPVDPEEPTPYEAQENVDEDVKQASDTETGRATRIAVGPQRQEDVPPGVWQRSHTPTGVATPIPGGGPVAAQEMKESSLAKEMRGEPTQAAAAPLKSATGAGGDGNVSNMPASLTQPGPGSIEGTTTQPNRTGLDAQGQPLYEDVARANALIPGKKAAEQTKGDPKDVKITKKDETPEVSGRAAKAEAVPDPAPTRRAKPPKGGQAEDQTADPNQQAPTAKK